MKPDADPLRRIANAVLYEGYVLWPYRKSATKNQRRWTFGGVYPRAHSAAHPDDRWTMQTQCLVEGAEPRVEAVVRFLHVVERRLASAGRDVDELTIDGVRHVAWDEATEREVRAPGPIEIPAGESEEDLGGGDPRAELAIARRGGRGPRRAARRGSAARDRAHREHDAVRRDGARGGPAADVLLDAHDPDGRRRRVRVAHRPSGRAARRSGAVPERGHLARAGRRAGRAPHAALLADHPGRLSARSRRRARATSSTEARSTSCWS